MITTDRLDRATRAAMADAALKLAAERPWRELSLGDLAAAAGRPCADFYPAVLEDALEAVEERFDFEVGEAVRASEGPVRDRLFDLAMRRFEAMEPHRAALTAISHTVERDPTAAVRLIGAGLRSARWLLTLAGLSSEGLAAARAPALAWVLADARRAWLKDDAGDFARTMVALDRGLRRMESIAQPLSFLFPDQRPYGGAKAS